MLSPNRLQKQPRIRRATGALGTVLFCIGMLVILGLVAFGVDVYHVVCIRDQLQNAADAGAIAGAMDLTSNPSKCSSDAYALTQANTADNWVVANSGPVTVNVIVAPPQNGGLGTVTVTASMNVNSLFSKIFHNYSNNISVIAVAGSAGKLVGTYSGGEFPIAVSMQLADLANKKVGDSINLYINSQQVKNAAFTSLTVKNTNANWFQDAISEALGIPLKSGDAGVWIPPCKIGDNIYLSNGVDGQKELAKDPYFGALMNGDTYYLPVINGDPSYTQTREVVGFVGVSFTNVTTNQSGGVVETLTATIKQSVTDGISAINLPSTGNQQQDVALNGFAPGVVKLIQ